ncbi:MAG: bifunctional hydroxymethylpyrimidine kinase/phosphomethylpyrimidine kinase, partial [Tannerellaceae bacterium]
METKHYRYPTALTIAGSDSSGGAGIQADLKTFSSLGVYGTSAITAITAQNTRGVRSIQPIDISVFKDQIDMVFEDLCIDAVKTGMIHNDKAAE